MDVPNPVRIAGSSRSPGGEPADAGHSTGPGSMRPREIGNTTNAIARGWAAAALLSMLLPAATRRGLWLPLHLFTAGAVTTAIVGNAQVIARALAAAPDPPRHLITAQLAAVSGGAGLIAVGVTQRWTAISVTGGLSFIAGIVLFAFGLAAIWARGRNRRHGGAFVLYGTSIAALLAGATIGTMLTAGVIGDGVTWMALRRAHVIVNILGWASLPIVASLATMMPAAARTRAPSTPAWLAPVMVGGVGASALGLSLGVTWVATVGATAWTVGCLGVVLRAARTVAARHASSPAGPMIHMGAAVLWLVGTSIALVVAMASGPAAFDGFRDVALIGFLAGWIGQTLGGAWLMLLPAQRAADIPLRRAMVAALERGAVLTAVVFNAGLVALLAGRSGWLPEVAVRLGGIAALLAAGVLLLRTVLYPSIARRAGAAPAARASSRSA